MILFGEPENAGKEAAFVRTLTRNQPGLTEFM
jgi:hypothetical protein